MNEPGRLSLEQLRAEVESGAIDTVITALPDLYGRLVGKRITAPVVEFATPLRPLGAAGIWDRYGLWTVVAVVLVLLAYGYPLYYLISQPRFGSPGYQPF